MSAEDPAGPAVLCWDGSASAARAIRQAAKILGAGHRAVVFFAHVPTESSRGLLAGPSGPDAPIMGVTDAEGLLEQGVRAARDAGFDASGMLVHAERKTAALIIETADEQDAPVIVMGQRGRSAIGVALLGSVARDVINGFHRPVLVVGPADSEPGSGAPARDRP
jgi:nucleotide-binding universal stress UspA family protein